MSLKKTNTKLFNEVGCLNKNTIKNYIEGKLSKEDLLEVESHTKECQICSEALSGARYFSNSRTYNHSIRLMRRSFVKNRNRTVDKPGRWSANAIIFLAVLILLIGMYHILSTRNNQINESANDYKLIEIVDSVSDTIKTQNTDVTNQELK